LFLSLKHIHSISFNNHFNKGKYGLLLQKERDSKEYWGELFKKMHEMQFTPQEQTIIKRDVL